MARLQTTTPWGRTVLFAVLLGIFLVLVEAVEGEGGKDSNTGSELQPRGGYPKKPYAQNQAVLQASHVEFVGNATRTSAPGVALFERAYSKCHAQLSLMSPCDLVSCCRYHLIVFKGIIC
jgi:hypothetical protein